MHFDLLKAISRTCSVRSLSLPRRSPPGLFAELQYIGLRKSGGVVTA
jgi:hypothetical protein